MKNDGGFPIYILDDDTIVFTKRNIDHFIFWRKKVCKIVAEKYKISAKDLHNLPYCQRRARVIESIIYCGEKLSRIILKNIERAANKRLRLIYDEHETRCKISTAEFNALRTPYQL